MPCLHHLPRRHLPAGAQRAVLLMFWGKGSSTKCSHRPPGLLGELAPHCERHSGREAERSCSGTETVGLFVVTLPRAAKGQSQDHAWQRGQGRSKGKGALWEGEGPN